MNVKNKESYLPSVGNLGLLKYLKDKAIILYCLKQAGSGMEDIQHIFHAVWPPVPNSVTSSVLCHGENLAGKSRKRTDSATKVKK